MQHDRRPVVQIGARAWTVLVCVFLALPISLRTQTDGVRELTILHLNDLHARLLPDADGLGGFAHLATLLQRERVTAGASITLHAGDLVQGTPVSTLFEGVPAFELANFLGLDANCLGNHEFDYGWEKIGAFMDVARFPTIATNVVNASGQRLLPEAYLLRESGGLRVAIIGALMESVGPWGPWRAAPIVQTLRPIVADARGRADVIVVLGHLVRAEIEAILRELPDVAVIVAGHNHRGLEEPLVIDGRIAVHAQGYGREVGRLRLRYDTRANRVASHEWTRIAVDSTVYPADSDTKAAVDRWESKVSALVDVPVGRASRRMLRDELREQIQRVLLDRYSADVAFISRGEIRDVLPEGELLARHLWNVSPYEDRVVTLDISGERLLQVLNAQQPPALAAGITPIRTDQRYRVATIDFFGRDWIGGFPDARMADENLLLRDLFIGWVRDRGVVP